MPIRPRSPSLTRTTSPTSGVPTANPVAALEASFTQMRADVTRYFSWAFVGSPSVRLQ